MSDSLSVGFNQNVGGRKYTFIAISMGDLVPALSHRAS